MAILGVVGAPLGGYTAASPVGASGALGGLTCALAFGTLPFVESHAARLAAMAGGLRGVVPDERDVRDGKRRDARAAAARRAR